MISTSTSQCAVPDTHIAGHAMSNEVNELTEKELQAPTENSRPVRTEKNTSAPRSEAVYSGAMMSLIRGT